MTMRAGSSSAKDLSSSACALPLFQPAPGDASGPPKAALAGRAAGSPKQHAALLAQQLAAGALTLAAPLLPVAIAAAGVYVTALEAGPGRPVDRTSCSCTCWDGRFKGRHGVSTAGKQYKSIYFNLELPTLLIAAWVGVWLHLLQLCLARLLLLFRAGRLSYAALVPALLSFYPLFYGSWSVANYINDRFWLMLPSQLFFQLTELLSATLIYSLLDRGARAGVPPLAPVLGLAVNAAHVVIALKERVLLGLVLPGVHTVNARDVMLVAGDAACLAFFGRLLAGLRLPRREQLALLPWGLGAAVGLVGVYLALFGYEYQ